MKNRIDEGLGMEPVSESREIERDTIIARMRERLRRLSRHDESALLRDFADLVGKYEEEFDSGEDRELWLRNEKRKALGRKELMAECLTFEETAELLGLREPALHMRIKRNKVLSFKDRKKHFFPRWQFDLVEEDQMVKGFNRVLEALKDASSDEMKILWLNRPWRGFDGKKPIEVLRSGRIDEVVEFAQSLGGGHR